MLECHIRYSIRIRYVELYKKKQIFIYIYNGDYIKKQFYIIIELEITLLIPRL